MYRHWNSREKEDRSTKLGRMSLRCRASEGLSVNCWLIVFRSPPWSQIINDVSKIIEIYTPPPLPLHLVLIYDLQSNPLNVDIIL